MVSRRKFIKKTMLAGLSAVVAPQLLNAKERLLPQRQPVLPKETSGVSRYLVKKNNGLRITGTFLDEISHDIPHQNWGENGSRISVT